MGKQWRIKRFTPGQHHGGQPLRLQVLHELTALAGDDDFGRPDMPQVQRTKQVRECRWGIAHHAGEQLKDAIGMFAIMLGTSGSGQTEAQS